MEDFKLEIEKQELIKFEDWERLFNAAIDPLILLDLDGNVITLNKKAAKILDKNVDELIGLNIYSFMSPNEVKFFKTQINNIARLGKPVRIEKEIFGRIFDLSINSIFDEQGKVEQIAVLFHDITEHKKIEEQLRIKSKDIELLMYKSFIENSGTEITIVNKDGICLVINEQAAKRFNGKPNDFIGKSLFDMFPKEIAEGYFKSNLKIIETGKGKSEEKTFNTPSGERTFFISTQPVANYEGINSYLVINALDITERNRKEELLKESKENFQDAYNRMLLYQDFIAHDIRNVLNNVQSLVYLYERYQNKSEKMNKMNEIIKMIKKQIVQGDILMKNFRKLSNLENIQVSLKLVDVLNVLEECINFIDSSFKNRDLSIQVESVSDEIFVQADDLLFDVFQNILNNAVKHNNNPTVEIMIRIVKEERGMKKYIQFEFIDNGNGIPDHRKQLIFQRNHLKKEYVKGKGIGLSLVFKIIKNYDGEIWLEDKVKGDCSKGSKFVILIPEAY